MKRRYKLFLVLLLCALFSGVAEGDMYQRRESAGKQYEYNNLIRTILFVGVDSKEDLKTWNRYTVAPRADTIELVILDGYQKKISVLAISRDTMTGIHRFAMDGTDRGSFISHLGYAYTFGDGGKASCLNVVEAVSDLLGGIPIHEYVVVNESGIIRGNRLVDGVEVLVPNDDLVEKYPYMLNGSVVTLTDADVCDYVKYRDTGKAFSNTGRMERARSFTTAFIAKLRECIAVSPRGVWQQIESMGDCMYTSITRNQYLTLADEILSYTGSDIDYLYLGGEDKSGDTHDEVWLDHEDVTTLCLQLFYHEQK